MATGLTGNGCYLAQKVRGLGRATVYGRLSGPFSDPMIIRPNIEGTRKGTITSTTPHTTSVRKLPCVLDKLAKLWNMLPGPNRGSLSETHTNQVGMSMQGRMGLSEIICF